MCGTAGSALVAGFLIEDPARHTTMHACRSIFILYAVAGAINLSCCCCLSAKVEQANLLPPASERRTIADAAPREQTRLLTKESMDGYETISGVTQQDRFTNEVSCESASDSDKFIWRFCLVTMVDYLASGLAQMPWMFYFFVREFKIPEKSLGLAIFFARVGSMFLNLCRSPIKGSNGQVLTIMLCHALNAMSLLLSKMPKNHAAAISLFMFRIMTRELDSESRLSFVAANVRDEKRPRAMRYFNVARALGSCVGLFVTGQFALGKDFRTAFTGAGIIKLLLYNAFVLIFFWKFKTRASRALGLSR